MSFVEIFRNSFVLQVGMTAIPILLWMWWFQRNYKAKPKRVFMSFLAGMLSVVPIKLYQRYWDEALLFFEHTNVFRYMNTLLDTTEASELLAYVTVHGLVAFLLFLFTLVLIGTLELGTSDNSLAAFADKVKRAAESPLFYVTIGTAVGVIAFMTSFSLEETLWFFVIVGMLEEYIKHLCLRLSDDESIESTGDAVSYAIIVALGFAFVENILYFRDFIDMVKPTEGQFFSLFGLRSTVSVLAHVCFSAIFGYFYGQAKFAKEICDRKYVGCKTGLLVFLQRVFHLRKDIAYHDGKMLEGLFISMILHAIFNLFLELNLYPLLLPLLVGMYVFMMSLFHRKKMYISQQDMREFDS